MPSSAALYADLEIRILEREPKGYPAEITLKGEQYSPRGYLVPGLLPWVPTADPEADGERLFRSLLAGDTLAAAWAQVRGAHASRRLRLRIDDSAPELHTLPWELLCETGGDGLRQVLLRRDAKSGPCTLVGLEGRLKEGFHILHFIGLGFRRWQDRGTLCCA